MDIKIALRKDWADIIAIYNHSIDTGFSTADLSPVTIESRRDWLMQHTAERYPIFIAVENKRTVGWCSLSPYRPGRAALQHTSEISYYIHPQHQQKGIASALIAHAIRACPKLGISTIFAILLDINIPSINLLEKLTFKKWGHLPGVAQIKNRECGQYIYGLKVGEFISSFEYAFK